MVVALMQPYFLPYIGTFQLLNKVEKYIFYDDVNYLKKGFINRNTFQFSGKYKFLSFPLSNSSQNKQIKDISVAENFSAMLHKIEHSYTKSPYFPDLKELIEVLQGIDSEKIAVINGNSIAAIANYFELKADCAYSSQLVYDRSHSGENRVLNLLKRLGATCYINPIGGKHLYTENLFADAGIALKFFQPEVIDGQYVSVLHDVAMYGKAAVKDQIVSGGRVE